MGRIVVSENISLDGVMQDPTGDEGSAGGGWFGRVSEADRAAWAEIQFDEATRAEALLLGRRSYEWFAARWPARTGAWADRLRALPKFVISSTRPQTGWANTTVLTGAVAEEVRRLKDEREGEIVVYASGELVRALLDLDLVDEVRLMVFPVILRGGRRLFTEGEAMRPLRLVESRTVGDQLAYLIHEVGHQAGLVP